MATPTYEEMLQGSTTWRKSHRGVDIVISHHGYMRGDEYPGARPMPGTWCYYLVIPEQMFPHRWADFACTRKSNGYSEPGPGWNHNWFDSEITWSSSEPYFDRTALRVFDAAKVGCDYAHLWHAERGYPDTFASVTADALRTAEAFLTANPDRKLRSCYSGKWDEAERFYTAINGSLVHVDDEIPDGWDAWRQAPERSAS